EIAILVDWKAIDEVHHQVRYALVGDTAVQKLDDVRMIQCGQCLPLAEKSFPDRLVSSPTAHHLDGDALARLLVSALAQIHHRHTALAAVADNPVCADLPADQLASLVDIRHRRFTPILRRHQRPPDSFPALRGRRISPYQARPLRSGMASGFASLSGADSRSLPVTSFRPLQTPARGEKGGHHGCN